MVLSMKVELEEISPVQRKLSVLVPSQKVDKQMDLAYRKWGGKAKIKGFRPGKAPRSILQRYYGKEIEQEVSQELFHQSLNEALQEANLKPVALRPPDQLPPIVHGDDYMYSIELEVAPEFTPENYLNLNLTAPEVAVTEEMVEQRLHEIQQQQATLEPIAADRPIQDKDIVVIDYKAFAEGKPIEGGNSDNAYLEIGAGKLPAEFELHLIGLKKGEETAFPLEVPADFINPVLAGRTADFKIRVIDIKELKIPELDDALAQSLSERFSTLADLRQVVEADLQRRGEQQRYEELRRQALEQILESNPVDAPPSLVRQEQERTVRQQLNVLHRQGLNIAALDPEKLLERAREAAEKQTKINLILEKIAAREGLIVTEEDLETGYQRIAEQAGDTPQMVKKIYQEKELVDDLRGQIRGEKTIEFLIDKASITNPTEAATETAEKES